jgi:hypothetical protein
MVLQVANGYSKMWHFVCGSGICRGSWSKKFALRTCFAAALPSGAYSSSDDVIDRALEVLERAEGIPEDELDAYLARLKPSLNESPLYLGSPSQSATSYKSGGT